MHWQYESVRMQHFQDRNAPRLRAIPYGIHYHVHNRNVANETEGIKFS